jgi:alanine-synthesizing transaminase
MEHLQDYSWLYQDPIAEITALKRKLVLEGKEILDLSMVNPDLLPSAVALDALHEYTLKGSNHRYAVSRGVRKLRQAFSDKYSAAFGVTLDPEREICVCSGTKDALIHLLHVLVNPGETVVVPAPSYPMHLSAIKLARAHHATFEVSLSEEKTLQSITEVLDQTKAKILLVNFPNNPTGLSVSEHFLKLLAQATMSRGVTIINDFVYGEMAFHATPPSFLSMRGMNPNIVETYSLSKAYSIPGWRVGALLGDEAVVRSVARLKSHSDYGIFLPLQYAAADLLTNTLGLSQAVTGQYERRARILIEGLQSLGWHVMQPAAGASVWASVPTEFQAMGASHMARALLEKSHLHLTPGDLYGEGYERWMRFALVVSEEKMHHVLEKLQQFQTGLGH